MEEVTIAEMLGIVKDAGVIGLLVIVVAGGARCWWVYGWVYRAACEERDWWRRAAVEGTNIAERALSQAEKGRRS